MSLLNSYISVTAKNQYIYKFRCCINVLIAVMELGYNGSPGQYDSWVAGAQNVTRVPCLVRRVVMCTEQECLWDGR